MKRSGIERSAARSRGGEPGVGRSAAVSRKRKRAAERSEAGSNFFLRFQKTRVLEMSPGLVSFSKGGPTLEKL